MELTLTRRELIAAFLGTAAARRAFARQPGPTAFAGSVVDRVVEEGHRLRGASPLPRSTEPPEPLEVLVVGAGVAGLSAAWRLSGSGLTGVRILELDAEAGGTSKSGRNAISAFPWGAHYLPAPLEAVGPVPRLLREVGALTGVDGAGRPTYAEEMLIHEPEERLFYRGHWYEGLYLRAGASTGDLAELARFETAMRGFAAAVDGRGRRAFAVPTERASDDAEWAALDRLPFATWLTQNGYRSSRLLSLVDYACRDDFGARPLDVSAWAGIFYFAARQSADGTRHQGYLSWPEGNGRLVAQLRKGAAGAKLETGLLVHAVTVEKDHCRIDAWDTAGKRPRAFRARQCIFAAPRFIAARVVRTEGAAPVSVPAADYGPWLVANVTLREPPRSRGFPLAWDNVLHGSQSLGYVVATHQRERSHVEGGTVLTWYYPLVGADPKRERERLLGTTHADACTLVLADLSPAHEGLATQIESIDVMRWGHAMVRPRPGFRAERARLSLALGGCLHFAHTDLSGIALFEEANWHGVRAAEDVLRALGRRGPSWLSAAA